jgi:hypothetical protein
MLHCELCSLGSKQSIVEHFDTQNISDLICIAYCLVYCSLRIYWPKGTFLTEEHLIESTLDLWMPVLHIIALFLSCQQWFFLLKTFDYMSIWIQLLYRGFLDSLGFMVLFIILILFYAYVYHCLGLGLVPGDWEISIKPPYAFWMIVGVIRNSIGDIQNISFDFWERQY